MKKIFFFGAILCLAAGLQAQSNLLIEECFEYDALRPLITDTITGSDNYDGVTGWSTQSNKNSGKTLFTITDAPLTYEGYAGSGIGNALKFTPNNMTGQSVFKNWDHGIVNDSTIYVAFMIQFVKDTQDYANADYFMAIRMEPAANSTNFAGRLYAISDNTYPGEEITMGLNKASNGTAQYVGEEGPYLTYGKTYLMVYKYYVGVLNGKTADEEAGKYDDQIWLYINPTLDKEPEKADIHIVDPVAKDAYRLSSSGKAMGSLRGFYLRGGEPGKKNTINPYIIDGIRVGRSWEEVVPGDISALNYVKGQSTKSAKLFDNANIVIEKNGLRYNVLGVQLY